MLLLDKIIPNSTVVRENFEHFENSYPESLKNASKKLKIMYNFSQFCNNAMYDCFLELIMCPRIF